MAAKKPRYLVDSVKPANEQIVELSKKAEAIGRLADLVRDMEDLVKQLARRPGALGDPIYNTRHKGGIVYRALFRSVIVHYVVFEAEQAVFVLTVAPLVGSYLDLE